MASFMQGRNSVRCLVWIAKTSKDLQKSLINHSSSEIRFSTPVLEQALSFRFSSQRRCFSSDNQDKSGIKNKKKDAEVSVWEQLQSPPNIITMTRIASTPLLVYWITSEQYAIAVTGCLLAGLSDGLDGYLAKTYNWGTTVGTYLDPVADKIMVNSLALSLWYTDILPTPLIAVWAIKDVGLLSGTAWMLYKNYDSINFFTTSLKHKPLEVKPTQVAKFNTALQFATLGVGIISPISSFSPVVLDTLCWTTGATTIGSVLSYAGHSAIERASKANK